MSETPEILSKKESTRIYTLFYSFFLIPFMIAIFGAVFFLLFRFITFETDDASALLNQVKIGSASKRWQSAFELSKVFNNPDKIPTDISFKNQMVSSYNHAIHDDPLVRAYLALAMGVTQDDFYATVLVDGLNDENRESRLAAVQAVGMIGTSAASPKLKELVQDSNFPQERLASTIALGLIGDEESIPLLRELLEDEEPNIQWDAAIGLAKMGDSTGAFIIESLMDRHYLSAFPQVDESEKNQAILIAIEVASFLKNDRLENKLISLAESDENLKIRDAAMKTLESAYNRVL
ncbi:MAG: HEAT repeat domain-containing protein [Candidatus Marinimicrobia bacterium]|jgi:HEAT repeat protein|nr:HEAT repeat domain-containing protein [Candidatus Neomarinimicrobiota bacterium]MBT4154615.1 HEAT repeat domain-containing protein [Candidatus Neomarinimicrobiota bacterium]MBT6797018.1 HEAT repeat domain-containing protein [Candidatus Neomarinimicrobiota bacterium]MBT7944712.1 HEAT repeat domain-containing protein [Candidatus Neomarinimicrobiota bacterium]